MGRRKRPLPLATATTASSFLQEALYPSHTSIPKPPKTPSMPTGITDTPWGSFFHVYTEEDPAVLGDFMLLQEQSRLLGLNTTSHDGGLPWPTTSSDDDLSKRVSSTAPSTTSAPPSMWINTDIARAGLAMAMTESLSPTTVIPTSAASMSASPPTKKPIQDDPLALLSNTTGISSKTFQDIWMHQLERFDNPPFGIDEHHAFEIGAIELRLVLVFETTDFVSFIFHKGI